MKYFIYDESSIDYAAFNVLEENKARYMVHEPVVSKIFPDSETECPDFYICPIHFCHEKDYGIVVDVLKHFKKHPEKHVFFDSKDSPAVPKEIQNSVVFKTSANRLNKCLGLNYSIPEICHLVTSW